MDECVGPAESLLVVIAVVSTEQYYKSCRSFVSEESLQHVWYLAYVHGQARSYLGQFLWVVSVCLTD